MGEGDKKSGLAEEVNKDLEAVQNLMQVSQERQALSEGAEKAKALRVQMCGYLLESGLAASKLPAAMQEHLRTTFANRVFEPAELNQAMDSARELVSKIAGPGAISGRRGGSMGCTQPKISCRLRWTIS